uniref:Uncharacterized protein n=1 Tax=Trichogramma kaykai TaxID=54128 RepID=A0ABD2WIZ1_9HYME
MIRLIHTICAKSLSYILYKPRSWRSTTSKIKRRKARARLESESCPSASILHHIAASHLRRACSMPFIRCVYTYLYVLFYGRRAPLAFVTDSTSSLPPRDDLCSLAYCTPRSCEVYKF